MNQVIFTPLARQDLIEIFDYAAAGDIEQAAKHLRLINEKCRLLAKFPEMGRLRHEFYINLRSFPVRKHIVFYQSIENGIEVLRILHASRDISEIFNEMVDETKKIN